MAATVACALWVLGFELLPDLHLALHAHLGAHAHEADAPPAPGETVYYVHTDAEPVHVHGDGTIHGLTTPAAAPRGHRVEREAPRPRHGAHSLAHRGVASHTPPVPITAPLPVVLRPLPVVFASPTAPAACAAVAPSARGPPVGVLA